MLVRAVAAGCAFVLLTGCAAEAEPVPMPPLTAEPDFPLFASQTPDGAAAPQSLDGREARAALQKILRGAGAGRTAVCANVGPGYARKRLGGTCADWIAALSPEDRAKLSAVRVRKAVAGSAANVWVVRARDLVWPRGAPTSPDRPRYVLRHREGRWVLSG
ncbi:hypothetical protein LO762_18820 [Actinocorallia sp. API 0066]|uniref:hypothetical protein n=1 Tax=Actinocorallia sp. API 0066 TaxID=2896846 RepID=UPI001E3D787F|nr:hypothetical protein [Actinocorallia sp. API 0066]MCD0451235.1 hypothetical protein [Actinocorallia sp. API 0066]